MSSFVAASVTTASTSCWLMPWPLSLTFSASLSAFESLSFCPLSFRSGLPPCLHGFGGLTGLCRLLHWLCSWGHLNDRLVRSGPCMHIGLNRREGGIVYRDPDCVTIGSRNQIRRWLPRDVLIACNPRIVVEKHEDGTASSVMPSPSPSTS